MCSMCAGEREKVWGKRVRVGSERVVHKRELKRVRERESGGLVREKVKERECGVSKRVRERVGMWGV